MVVIPADQGQEPGLIVAVYSYLKTVQSFNMHNVSPCVLCLSFRHSHSLGTSSLRHRNTQRKQARMEASKNTRCNESLRLALWQNQWTVGRRWQLRKIDEPKVKGCIPLDILRKHFDLASLGSHKTPWQLIQSFKPYTHESQWQQWHCAFQCLNSELSWVGVGPSGAPNPALGDTVVWKGHREEVKCHGSGFFLIDEWTWMTTGQSWPFEDSSSQNKFINRPYFRNPAYSKHTDRMGYWIHSTVTPDFPPGWQKTPTRASVSISWPPQLHFSIFLSTLCVLQQTSA